MSAQKGEGSERNVESERNIFSSTESIARHERLPDFRCKCGIRASIISRERNNLNGRMSVERQSHFLSPVRGYDSKHDPLLRFRDTCLLHVFKRNGAARSANLNGTFERLVHRLIFRRSCFGISHVNFETNYMENISPV